MQYERLIIITGTTSGLGKRFIEIASKNSKNKILTINRHKVTYNRNNISNLYYDLSNTNNFKNINIEIDNAIDNVIFINNAFDECLGDIKYLNSNNIINSLNTNITSSVLILNYILNKIENNQLLKIINITSDVVNNYIDNLTIYSCTKKFMYDFVERLENENENVESINFYPGIFESNMQKRTRNSYLLKKNVKKYFKNMYLNNLFDDIDNVVNNLINLI